LPRFHPRFKFVASAHSQPPGIDLIGGTRGKGAVMPRRTFGLKRKITGDEPDFSFMLLLETHEKLIKMFLHHQEALLRGNFSRALQRLKDYERKIKRHIREEGEFLLPIYARAGKVVGGDPRSSPESTDGSWSSLGG
jgi:hypothetical protein